MTFSPELEERFAKMLQSYPPGRERAAMVPMLIYAQDEVGCISEELIDEVAKLLKDIGIPVTLKELGLPEDKQDWTAESAIGAARLVNNNPRKLDVDALKAITRAAFSGDRSALAS